MRSGFDVSNHTVAQLTMAMHSMADTSLHDHDHRRLRSTAFR